MSNSTLNESTEHDDPMAKILRLLRLSLGGAVLAVSTYGTVAAILGLDTTTIGDLTAAVLGGGATATVIKTSLLA